MKNTPVIEIDAMDNENVLAKISSKERTALPDSVFLFPKERIFPIRPGQPNDVKNAIRRFGSSNLKITYDVFLSKLYNHIKNNPELVNALPDDSKVKLGLTKK